MLIKIFTYVKYFFPDNGFGTGIAANGKCRPVDIALRAANDPYSFNIKQIDQVGRYCFNVLTKECKESSST